MSDAESSSDEPRLEASEQLANTLPIESESPEGLLGRPPDDPNDPVEGVRRDQIYEALFDLRQPRRRLGRYALLGPLGQGGMGTVLEAFDRTLDRRVALKVLHADLAERSQQRLLREAQALAKLSHPNVVQVYEVGEADDQVFVAMELVRGQTLKQWVDRVPRPSWRACVEVYRQAGEGLAAAHAAGLVHRDFKPDNACIDDRGRVRVLDFGLARQADDAPTEYAPRTRQPLTLDVEGLDTPLTQTGVVLGTPAYMPLEQMRGHEADARSDQFGFCASLYEALYAERPFAGGSLAALSVSLAGDEVRPAPDGHSVPEAVRAVILRGLASDPDARWPSMDALLEALERTVGSPRSSWQTTLGMVGAVAIAGAVLWSQNATRPCEGGEDPFAGIWDDARRDHAKAAILGTGLSYAPDTWERVEAQLDEYTQAWVAQHTDACEATHVRKEQSEAVMDLRMRCLSVRRTATREALEVLTEVDEGVVDKAVDMVAGLPRLSRCEEIEALEAEVPPPEDPAVAEQVETLRARLSRARSLEEAGEYGLGKAEATAVIEVAEGLAYPPLLAEALLVRGLAVEQQGEYDLAEQDLERAYTLAVGARYEAVEAEAASQLVWVVGVRKAQHARGQQWGTTALALADRSGARPVIEARAWHNLGIVLRQRGELAAALEHLRRALEIYEQTLGPEHPNVASTLGNIGTILRAQGEVVPALEHQRRALALTREILGPGHPRVAGALNNVGASLRAQGEVEAALEVLTQALEITEQALGPRHPNVAAALNNIGNVLLQQGQAESALEHLTRALAIWEHVHGDEHPDVVSALTNIGNVLRGLGRLPEALAHLERAVHISERLFGDDHPNVASALGSLGTVLAQQGRLPEALARQQRALTILEAALGPEHLEVAASYNNLGDVRIRLGEPSEALEHYRRALAIFEAARGPDDPAVATLRVNIGGALRQQGSLEQAASQQQRALAIFESAFGPEHPNVAYPLVEWARVEVLSGDLASARSHAERALKLRETPGHSPLEQAEARFVLAMALAQDGEQQTRAMALVEQALVASTASLREEIEAWRGAER